MKSLRCFGLLAGALCAVATCLAGQTAADSGGRFTIYKLQHPVGTETFRISHGALWPIAGFRP